MPKLSNPILLALAAGLVCSSVSAQAQVWRANSGGPGRLDVDSFTLSKP
jgi:hypothetical protein